MAKNVVQRDLKDVQHWFLLYNPEVYFFMWMMVGTAAAGVAMVFLNSGRWNETMYTTSAGGVTPNSAELFQRNYEMTEAIQRHRTVLDQVRAEIGEVPEVLRAPPSVVNWSE